MNGTLSCSRCGSGWGLVITNQSYDGDHAFEAYECEECGATGSLSHDPVGGTTLSGCLE